jgi:hypothetical protein
MSVRLVILFALAIVPALALVADDSSDRANLAGTWQLTGGSDKDAGAVWTLEAKGDSIRIAQSLNNQEVSSFECKVGGPECPIKDAGRNAKVSLWFNGPKLVQMETRGSEVVKRLYSASGDTLSVELIPIVPDGKPQTLTLKRVKAASAGH